MKYEEAIKRIEYLKNKAEIALINNNTSCEWLKKDVEGTITAFSMAIEALEKQVPKKLAFDAWSHNCPRCLETLVDNNKIHRKGVKKHYCPNCGQAIDWSEER